jgi:large-conductance mechanosensitive channel
MIKGFKDFALRGNVVDLAVAVDVELLTEIRDLLRAQHERAGGERQS